MTSDEIGRICATCLKGDQEASAALVEAIGWAGDGQILIEPKEGGGLELRRLAEMDFDFGYASPAFATDAERMSCTLEACSVLVMKVEGDAEQRLLPRWLQAAAPPSRALLLVAVGLGSDAIEALVHEHRRGARRCAVVAIPAGPGDALLDRVAALTRTSVRAESAKRLFEGGEPVELGSAFRVHVERGRTLLRVDVGAGADLAHAPSQRAALLQVGAATDADGAARRRRLQDALKVARAAIAGGVLPGGGVAFGSVVDAVDVARKSLRSAAIATEEALAMLIPKAGKPELTAVHTFESTWEARGAGVSQPEPRRSRFLESFDAVERGGSGLLDLPLSGDELLSARPPPVPGANPTSARDFGAASPLPPPAVRPAGASRPAEASSPFEVWPPAEASPPVDAPTVLRHVDVACPRRMWLGAERFSLVVRLTVAPSSLSVASRAGAVALRPSEPVRVRLSAPSFDVLSPLEQEIRIPASGDSDPVVFFLKPTALGERALLLDFLQSGNPVGSAAVQVEVTAMPGASSDTAHVSGAVRTSSASLAEAPERMLYIAYERSPAGGALTFTLIRKGEVGRTFTRVPLSSSPEDFTTSLYRELNLLRAGKDPTVDALGRPRLAIDREDVDMKIRDMGFELWKALFPEDFRRMYAAERKAWRDSSMIILSDEPFIPWELVWPYGTEPERWHDEEPWCLSMSLTRWLRRNEQGGGHEGPAAALRVDAFALLVPTDSNLPSAPKEKEFLARLLGQDRKLQDRSPKYATAKEVKALLKNGGYGLIHAATHGNFSTSAPDAITALWLEGGEPLSPRAINGPDIEAYLGDARPAFVFNACELGQGAWSLVGIGGWANRLISAGAGLFLAPLWLVSDDRAYAFCEALYRELANGAPVGKAVREARRAARKDGDPTHLAYCVYAHPNARFVFGSGA
ncbi:CHAT domain-containing protein [Sorangium sp. So ce861]|uniref:CHAT domain-containing protein n=1 Tax=Sorangium sp. So ce861 TaxID=3133323 RepID=UPI003F5E8EEE